jgi:hypothetical protein
MGEPIIPLSGLWRVLRRLGRGLGVAVLAALLTVCSGWQRAPVLTVTESRTGRVVLSEPVSAGDVLKIRYIHSIHRTPVEERYHIDRRGRIVLDSVRYESYGVGMLSELEPGETFHWEDGAMVVANLNRVIGSIPLRIGQVIADHHLLLHGMDVPLAKISHPGAFVVIAVRIASA